MTPALLPVPLLSLARRTPPRPSSASHRAAAGRSSAGLVPPRLGRALLADETGAATAEYAIATMAAVGFASLLVVIMRSDEVRGILTDMVRAALTVGV